MDWAAALIVAVREAGSGPMEGALLEWLEEQIDRVEDLKQSLDQKQRELAWLGAGKLGSWGRGCVVRRGSNPPGERFHMEVKDMFREQGFAAKESEAGGTKGNRALMALPNPKGALGALVAMHNYTPEGYEYATDQGGSFSSGRGAGQIRGRQEQEHPQVRASGGRSVQEQEPGQEREARNDVQQEWKQQEQQEWNQKMETEEGSKELRATAEARTGPCLVCKERHVCQRNCHGGTFNCQATGYRNARPSGP